MIPAMFIAAALITQASVLGGKVEKGTGGHPAVDQTYEPEIGDRALLGFVDSDEPEKAIRSARCFSSIEKAKLYFDSLEPQEGLDLEPDGYVVRAGTTAMFKAEQVVDSTQDGKPSRHEVAKVQILEGEFRNRTLFTPKWYMFRFVGDNKVRDQAATPPKKRTTRRGAAVIPSDAKLVLTDLASNPSLSTDYIKVDGRIRCISSTPLKRLQFTVSFEDSNGKLIRSESAYCEPDTLAAGEVGSITVITKSDPRIARMKVSFRDSDKNIPWADQSGMNAHD